MFCIENERGYTMIPQQYKLHSHYPITNLSQFFPKGSYAEFVAAVEEFLKEGNKVKGNR